MSDSAYRGRLAPTPSGFLHLGHLRTFRTAWERARAANGTLVLRIEDIDFERCRDEYVVAILKDLRDSGLDWSEGVEKGGHYGPYLQSQRMSFYRAALSRLVESGAVYPCSVSRKKIAESGLLARRKFDFMEPEYIFPPQFRVDFPGGDALSDIYSANWRFKVPDGESVKFSDNFFGDVSFTAGIDFGDFAVWRGGFGPMYELAVVVDDANMHISEVVRGADLLLSTARQILLYKALGLEVPEFYHCELLLGDDGRKLSKSTLPKNSPNIIRNRK